MALRNIVKIDEEKCNGCGLCVSACAEGAIKLINGKARLVSETYCDGLGACLGHCPQDAITIEQRQAHEFDEEATKAHLARQQQQQQQQQKPAPPPGGFVCPGTMARKLREQSAPSTASAEPQASQLTHWPVQLKLVSPQAPFFQDADLLLVADCVPFAMADFHSRLLRDHAVAVGCPKLDDTPYYVEKLAAILREGQPRSLTVVHMEVPCCFGLVRIAEQALAASGVNLPFTDVTVDLQGKVKSTRNVPAPATVAKR
jgi:Pyruvate/2-oxoacid:ferredoxin oxidoreductase delta subunit